MKKKKLLLLSVVLCVLVIVATAFYWYQKPRASLTNVKADYSLTAKELYDAFQQDEKKANQQFLEKVVEVTGTIDNVQATDSTTSLVLAAGEMGGINCSVRKKNSKEEPTLSKGANIKVKGRCIGFLMDVNLTDAIIEK